MEKYSETRLENLLSELCPAVHLPRRADASAVLNAIVIEVNVMQNGRKQT